MVFVGEALKLPFREAVGRRVATLARTRRVIPPVDTVFVLFFNPPYKTLLYVRQIVYPDVVHNRAYSPHHTGSLLWNVRLHTSRDFPYRGALLPV